MRDALVDILSSIRAPLHDEKATQISIAEQLDIQGLTYEREFNLNSQDIVDFMIGGIAIEIKIKGNRRQILRQLERYAESQDVQELILLTSRSIILPTTIYGKPVTIISLSKAWL